MVWQWYQLHHMQINLHTHSREITTSAPHHFIGRTFFLMPNQHHQKTETLIYKYNFIKLISLSYIVLINNTITEFKYFSENWICDGFQVDVAIIRQIIENVGSTHSLWTSLPISKDEVNPMM